MFSEEDDLYLEESKGPPIQEGQLDSSGLTEEESELERAQYEFEVSQSNWCSRCESAVSEAFSNPATMEVLKRHAILIDPDFWTVLFGSEFQPEAPYVEAVMVGSG